MLGLCKDYVLKDHRAVPPSQYLIANILRSLRESPSQNVSRRALITGLVSFPTLTWKLRV